MVTRFRVGYDAVRVFLAAVLLVAAGMKAYEIATAPLLETNLFRTRWFSIGLVEVEFGLGLWLLVGAWPRPAWRLAIACFSTFALVSLKHGVDGHSSCACFGQLPVNTWLVSLFDLSAVAALCIARPTAASARRGRGPRVAAAFCVFLGLAVPAGAFMAAYHAARLAQDGDIVTGADNAVVVEPTDWLGRRFPVLRHIDIGDELARGQWTLVFYHHDCADCRAAIARLESWLDGDQILRRRIALVEVPPFGELPASLSVEVARHTRARLGTDHDWFVATPMAAVLEDGRLVAARRLVN